MYVVVIDLDVPEGEDPQGIKEKLATDLERYGDVRVASVEWIRPEQTKMEGYR